MNIRLSHFPETCWFQWSLSGKQADFKTAWPLCLVSAQCPPDSSIGLTLWQPTQRADEGSRPWKPKIPLTASWSPSSLSLLELSSESLWHKNFLILFQRQPKSLGDHNPLLCKLLSTWWADRYPLSRWGKLFRNMEPDVVKSEESGHPFLKGDLQRPDL